ncbi:MAG: hypothetical protein M3Z02_10090 [Actinomycetota bacterium]|nr:hypothetical protein [Actinomycetota bacterium]
MSLVTTPTSQLARCSVCDSTRVTEISMTLTDGTPVDFTSCHACEHKSWRDSGQELSIDRVLTKAKKHKP